MGGARPQARLASEKETRPEASQRQSRREVHDMRILVLRCLLPLLFGACSIPHHAGERCSLVAAGTKPFSGRGRPWRAYSWSASCPGWGTAPGGSVAVRAGQNGPSMAGTCPKRRSVGSGYCARSVVRRHRRRIGSGGFVPCGSAARGPAMSALTCRGGVLAIAGCSASAERGTKTIRR